MLYSKKGLIRLIIPLVIEQGLAIAIGMIDTIMVSSVGESAVSAISLVDTINILLINIFAALATGGAVVSAQYIGKQEDHNARKAAKQLIYSVAIISILIGVIALVFRKPIISLAFGKIDSSVMNNCITYLTVSAFSYPFIALYNCGTALFRSMGNSKISMESSLIMNIMNIIMNAIFIYACHMDVFGAALATLIARAIGCIAVLYLLSNKDLIVHISNYLDIHLDLSMIKTILKIGIPNGLENGMFQIGKILVASIVSSFGTIAIAANAVAQNLAGMEIIPGAAIGLAMITIVGQCAGAGDYKQAKYYIKLLMKICYIFMFIFDSCMLLFGKQLIGMYSLSGETMQVAYKLLTYHTIFAIIVWPAAFTLPNAFRAANDAKYTMIISVASMWMFRIVASIILAKIFNLGVYGVWFAMFLDWFFRAGNFIYHYCKGKWMNKQLI